MFILIITCIAQTNDDRFGKVKKRFLLGGVL